MEERRKKIGTPRLKKGQKTQHGTEQENKKGVTTTNIHFLSFFSCIQILLSPPTIMPNKSN
jgi:hypothetical protein